MKNNLEMFEKIWKEQKDFQEFINNFPENNEEAEKMTKELILHMFSESDELLRKLNWKFHREKNITDKNGIKEELVDIFKYWLAIALFWEIKPEEFIEEFNRKSLVVRQRYLQEKQLKLLNGKRAICIDIDGVLADYPGGFIKFIEKEKGMDLKKFDMKIYDLYNELANHAGISKKEIKKLKKKFREIGQKKFLEVIPGAKEGMKEIKNLNYTIVLLSSRPAEKYTRIVADTIEWLNENDIPYDALYFDENKEEKIMNKIPDLNYLIEDCYENAIKLANENKKVILINKSYNQASEHKNIIRIKNWKEIIKVIKNGK